MATSIRHEHAPDLAMNNAVLNLDQDLTRSLAGASWTTTESQPQEALLSVLEVVLALLKDKLPFLETWLLVGTDAWQPNTRVVKHYGLWGALRARGLNVPEQRQTMPEVVIEAEAKLKFFAAGRVSEFSIADVSQILRAERCTYLVATPIGLAPDNLLKVGWSGDLIRDFDLISEVAERDALLLKQIGEFDDRERGIVALGRPHLVNAVSQ